MLHAGGALVLGLCLMLGACRAAPPLQSGAGTRPLSASGSDPESLHRRQLQGRFLHITDIHPDPFFKTYSSTEADAACHRKRGPAGVYGAETSGCDSPLSLVNETFKWINDNLKDSIDFVVWTGDSARHDNDEKIPRTQKQVIEQNEFVGQKFAEVFAKGDGGADPTDAFTIPIVPTFGNNDIMPHNIFLGGPNKWTLKYLDIWRNFIPEAQRHSFHQGGWFYVEVIPQKLAVFSLNTIYFFDSNSGVDGCADKNEPGYEHMEWLRIQLQIIRERGMKAILMGHVPPARTDAKLSWDETCWQKFTLWERQYRDVIVGSLFGHMNIDHFMLQDFKDIKKSTKKGKMASSAQERNLEERESLLEDGEVTVESASDYLIDLRDAWAKLPTPPKSNKKKAPSISEYIDTEEEEEPSIWQWIVATLSKSQKGDKSGKGDKSKKKQFLDKIGGKFGERFSIAHVAPSVVPNYFPTLRVYSYNISGLEVPEVPAVENHPSLSLVPTRPQIPIIHEDLFSDDNAWRNEVQHVVASKKKKKEKDARKKPKKWNFKIPSAPSKSAPPGPAYSPQSLTLLGYVQYSANLTHINNDFTNNSVAVTEEVDDMVFGLGHNEDGNVEPSKWKEGKHSKHQGKKPRPKPHPKKFKFEVEYDTTKDKLFKLKDLTVRSYIDLARRIGQEKSKKAVLGAADVEEGIGDEYEKEDEEYEIESDEDDYSTERKGNKKKGKKKKGKHGKLKKDGAWFTFVKRAFVGTMDPHELEDLFGRSDVEFEEERVEVLEL